VSSGTLGLVFALQALGVTRGTKVILPSFTFVATAQAVLYAGGIPLFVDVGNDLTVSAEDLAQLLRGNGGDAAVVIPVHMYGLPCSVKEIESIVDDHNRRTGRSLKVLYDAAHAFGSSLDGRKVGTFGTAEVFSLSVTKVLVSVEGGVVSSHDAELIRRIKKMRNYGIEQNYDAWYAGLNGKMSEFHAAVGLKNLARIEEFMSGRQQRAERYRRMIRAKTSFEVLSPSDGVRHTFKDFTILLPEESADRRGDVMRTLQEAGVETRAYFDPPVHEQRAFRVYADRPLPNTESLSRRVLTLPFYTTMTDDEIDYVVAALQKAEAEIHAGSI